MARPGPKRKLLPADLLDQLVMKHLQGVPKARIIRDYGLGITAPTLHDLLTNYITMTRLLGHKQKSRQALGQKIYNSLFPPWLDSTILAIQTEPDTARYAGVFPFGVWEKLEDVDTQRLYKAEVAHRASERSAQETS